MLVGARSQSDLLDLRDMLILLGITRAFVLLEPEPAQVRDATYWRVGCSGDFDQVEAGLLGASKCVLDRDDANLLALFIDDADLWHADLPVRTRAGWDRWARVIWSTGYGPASSYFFLGPLLAIGAFGVAFVRLPPFFDMSLLLSSTLRVERDLSGLTEARACNVEHLALATPSHTRNHNRHATSPNQSRCDLRASRQLRQRPGSL